MAEIIISPLNPVSDGNSGGFFGSLLNTIDNGFNIYANAQERINALKQINSETVNSAGPVSIAPTVDEQGLLSSAKKSLQNGSMALILAGILGIILVVVIMKRKG
jgi:hypothetical protein